MRGHLHGRVKLIRLPFTCRHSEIQMTVVCWWCLAIMWLLYPQWHFHVQVKLQVLAHADKYSVIYQFLWWLSLCQGHNVEIKELRKIIDHLLCWCTALFRTKELSKISSPQVDAMSKMRFDHCHCEMKHLCAYMTGRSQYSVNRGQRRIINQDQAKTFTTREKCNDGLLL